MTVPSIKGTGFQSAVDDLQRLLDTHQLTREELEAVLGAHLGVRKVLWLGRGIAGDDTHGHVDDLARFVDETTVAVAGPPAPVTPSRQSRARSGRGHHGLPPWPTTSPLMTRPRAGR